MSEKEKKKAPKLHELLAVESDLKSEFETVAAEARDTFKKRTEHFRGHDKTLKMKDEDRAMEEAAAHEHRDIVTTVGDKLKYTATSGQKYIDALLQKEATNQNAKADLVVDGVTLGEDLPATFLLAMESRLKTIREYMRAVPTHDPSVKWVPDPNQIKGVYVAEGDVAREKTEKQTVYQTVAEATEHHPAQIAKDVKNVVVGLFTTKNWSSMISPAQKSELLGRVDSLIRATKKARQRANQEEIVKTKIGKNIFEYLLKDI